MTEKQHVLLPLVETVVFQSNLLGRKVYYSVIEPERSREIRTTRSVLYLLHGLFGSHQNWTENTQILRYAREKDFIIVCPDAGDRWYTDDPACERANYESFILNEIIPDAEERFTAGRSRSRRAIAGISMGGYGALKFALRRPDTFCLAASMSGAFNAAEILNIAPRQEVVPSISTVFGTNDELRCRNSLTQLIENFPNDRVAELPRIYFDCGDSDEFFEANVAFDLRLKDKHVPHEFLQRRGDHSWEYWNRNLENIIELAGDEFAKEGA